LLKRFIKYCGKIFLPGKALPKLNQYWCSAY